MVLTLVCGFLTPEKKYTGRKTTSTIPKAIEQSMLPSGIDEMVELVWLYKDTLEESTARKYLDNIDVSGIYYAYYGGVFKF